VPQIVAALCGGTILSLVGSHQSSMMLVAGVSFILGSLCVFGIKDKK
jgi:maltose/moltooligosaccharide transporter